MTTINIRRIGEEELVGSPQWRRVEPGCWTVDLTAEAQQALDTVGYMNIGRERFDLSPIPKGSRIEQASLRVV